MTGEVAEGFKLQDSR